MNRKIATVAVLTLGIGIAISASAGELNPPPGPISPTGPSLSDLQDDINSINPGSGGASIGQITDVVDSANADINSNTNAGFDALLPRGSNLYTVFMKIGNLPGSSGDNDYPDHIRIDTADIVLSTEALLAGGPPRTSTPMISSIKVESTEVADANIARMYQNLAAGRNESFEVIFVQQSGNREVLMMIEFDQSFMTALELTETGYEAEFTPIKCVTITTVDINPQTGMPGPDSVFAWDVQTASPCN